MALLEILRPRGHQNVTLDGERLTIGKSDDNDLAIVEDPTVSRHHALLERVGVVQVVAARGALRHGVEFLAPFAERVAEPGRLGLELRQAELFPDLFGALHVFALGQRNRRVGLFQEFCC